MHNSDTYPAAQSRAEVAPQNIFCYYSLKGQTQKKICAWFTKHRKKLCFSSLHVMSRKKNYSYYLRNRVFLQSLFNADLLPVPTPSTLLKVHQKTQLLKWASTYHHYLTELKQMHFEYP